jgi:hypothetical protein
VLTEIFNFKEKLSLLKNKNKKFVVLNEGIAHSAMGTIMGELRRTIEITEKVKIFFNFSLTESVLI